MPVMKRRHFLAATAAAVGGITAGAGGTLGVQALATRPPVYPTEGPPSAQSYLPIDPANIAEAVNRLDSLVNDLMKRTGMPGVAVAVVHEDVIVYAKGFGVRRVGTTDVVDADSVFQLASLSKSISATAISGAVAAGVAGWDDPIVKHLPAFTLHDDYATSNVTVADMFSHRSGLPGHAGDLIEDLGFSAATIQQRLRH